MTTTLRLAAIVVMLAGGIAPARLGLCARLNAQATFEQTARDLENPDAGVRRRAVRMLGEAGYPEAAVPLAQAVTDQKEDVQLEAIAAELAIFRAEQTARRSRLGSLIEGPKQVSSEALFAAGVSRLGPLPVPAAVLAALLKTSLSTNKEVALEAIYAFGVLAAEPGGTRRRDLLRASAGDLAALTVSRETAVRIAAIRVAGRVFERRPGDEPLEPRVGDAIIVALKDKEGSVKSAAMRALGEMRYQPAVQSLTEMFEFYRNGELADGAFAGLTRIAHPSSAGLFLPLLSSHSAAIKVMAIEGLGRIGARTNLAAIQTSLAKERDDTVLLASSFASALLANEAIDQLAQALRRPKLRDQAKQYLAEVAVGGRPALSPLLQDPDPQMRADVAEAVGLSRDPAVLLLVTPLVKDPDPQVARTAERAVARLQ